jgi:oxygen-independent coproporphyrinogen III oxidase
MTVSGLYVHIPFCRQRCPYCAFVSVPGRQELHDRYVDAVCRELRAARTLAIRGPLATVFFGGGTPSVLRPGQLGRILETADAELGVEARAEITIEANPGTVDQAGFDELRAVGFNRLSLGVQSLVDADLRRLGRLHGAAQAENAYWLARRSGFENVNLDLIFSIPGGAADNWRSTLERAVALGPEHLSTYALAVEDGTPLAGLVGQGSVEPVDEDEDARTYEWTIERLTGAGYEHYEVSNFARPGYRSRHNWGYWTGARYLGVGTAAHSLIGNRRSWNTSDLEVYIQALEAGRSPGEGEEEIDPLTAARERVWMGLRTDQGVVLDEAERRLVERPGRFGDLLAAGFLEFSGDRLRLTRSGFPLADALGIEIVEILESGTPAGSRPCPGRKA